MTLTHEVTGDGPALLLLHSSVCDRRMWEPQWHAFAEAGYRVVRCDFRGFGDTPVATAPYSDAQDVVDLLDALGIERTAVVAASYGGGVALELAARWPARVDMLALLCTAADGFEPTASVEQFASREDALIEAGDLAGAVELNVSTWLGPDASDDVRALVGEMQRRAFDVQLAAEEDISPSETEFDPAGITAPTLVVSGAHDLDHFRTIAAELAGRVPLAHHTELPWAGHLPSLERPAQTTALLLEFLRRRAESHQSAEHGGADGMTSEVPFVVRPATVGDAPLVCALLNEIDTIETGRPDTDLHTVETELAHPEVILAEDSWLAFQGDRLVAYAFVWDESGGERIDADHYVLPGYGHTGEHLLALVERRALERAHANGAPRAVLHLQLNARPTTDLDMIGRRGWGRVREYHVMTRRLSGDDLTVPEPPGGIVLRDCGDEADRRRAHALLQETFSEHFDHQARTYDQWLEDIGAAHVDWSLVWIAALDGDDVAVLLSRNDRRSMAWISNIGVRRSCRGRGIAGHLLRHAFAAYAARGRDSIGLGVDTHNETGALRIYEAHGMRTDYAVDTWEVVLQAPAPAPVPVPAPLPTGPRPAPGPGR
ncbi:alpha/beta fold hydrolase [Streptomyces sp. TRM49041]|uniref:alpha/beta fold hydrolase n=1 Tax=Streptomyces sp. TRM49041 TaxID=2603216 RepID=UPI00292A4265|nr:alpha/beta fold hydrolase [Streptomyces sp. TRM49041]